MRRGGLGIMIFLVVALVVAFLAMKYIQNPTALKDKAQEAATQAAQTAIETVNNTVQEAMNDPSVQQSVNNIAQSILPQLEGEG